MGNTKSSYREIARSHVKPTGIVYDPRPAWYRRHRKKIRAMIYRGDLAPIWEPSEEPTNSRKKECEICTLYYPALNKTTCCGHSICTECFLELFPTGSTAGQSCPFCVNEPFSIHSSISTSLTIHTKSRKSSHHRKVKKEKEIVNEPTDDEDEEIDEEKYNEAYKNSKAEYERIREEATKKLAEEAELNKEELLELKRQIEENRQIMPPAIEPQGRRMVEARPIPATLTDLFQLLQRGRGVPQDIEELLLQRVLEMSRTDF